MTEVTNTTAQIQADPTLFLLDSLVMGGSPAIEAMESRGQYELVNSMVLPVGGTENPALWAAIGVTLGEPVENDPIFRTAQLPDGWNKQPTEHSMWSDLVDERGRIRANIFYKAAFYDRSAHISLARRFRSTRVSVDDYETYDFYQVIEDSGQEVWRSALYEAPKLDGRESAEQIGKIWEIAQVEAELWLLEHGYPEWENPLLYWEEE